MVDITTFLLNRKFNLEELRSEINRHLEAGYKVGAVIPVRHRIFFLRYRILFYKKY